MFVGSTVTFFVHSPGLGVTLSAVDTLEGSSGKDIGRVGWQEGDSTDAQVAS